MRSQENALASQENWVKVVALKSWGDLAQEFFDIAKATIGKWWSGRSDVASRMLRLRAPVVRVGERFEPSDHHQSILVLGWMRSAHRRYHSGDCGERDNIPMTTRTTTVNTASVKLSNKTNLNLSVTNQAEARKLVKDFQTNIASVKNGFGDEARKLASRKRDALYEDLAAASAIAQVLLSDEQSKAYEAILNEHGLDPVLDPSVRNEFVPVCRLLWGWWPKPTKAQEEAGEDVPFTWDRSVELYAKVLRGAQVLGIQPHDLAKELKVKKGFRKFKLADDGEHLKDDEQEQKRQAAYKALLAEPPVATIQVSEHLGITSEDKKRQQFVALLCRVSADGKTLEVVTRLKDKHAALDAKAYVIAEEQSLVISNRKLKRENEELKANSNKSVKQAIQKVAHETGEMLRANEAKAA